MTPTKSTLDRRMTCLSELDVWYCPECGGGFIPAYEHHMFINRTKVEDMEEVLIADAEVWKTETSGKWFSRVSIPRGGRLGGLDSRVFLVLAVKTMKEAKVEGERVAKLLGWQIKRWTKG